MVKPEWGTKRACQKCKAHFYDLRRDPIICPKCETEFHPEIAKKRRRGRGGAEEEAVKLEASKGALGREQGTDELGDLSFEQEEDLLEDTADIVDEEDDMDDVIERPSDDDLE